MNKSTNKVVANAATKSKEMLTMANDIYDAINESATASEELRTTVKSIFEKHGLAVARAFRDYSLSELSEMIDDGSASKLLNVGDERDIELITGEKVTVVILDFDHDDKADGSGEATITLGLKNLMDGDFAMNLEDTNEGGWAKSRMRNVYMQRIFKLFPEEWQNIIVPVRKRTSSGGYSQGIAEMEDKLFLFSVAEIFSSSAIKESDWSTIKDNAAMYNAEGKQYAYYAGLIGDADPDDAQELLVKRSSNRSGSAVNWWLRSARPDRLDLLPLCPPLWRRLRLPSRASRPACASAFASKIKNSPSLCAGRYSYERLRVNYLEICKIKIFQKNSRKYLQYV